MILDEVDQLDSKNQEVLYTMFEWPALENSRLLLIGNFSEVTNVNDVNLQTEPKLCNKDFIYQFSLVWFKHFTDHDSSVSCAK